VRHSCCDINMMPPHLFVCSSDHSLPHRSQFVSLAGAMEFPMELVAVDMVPTEVAMALQLESMEAEDELLRGAPTWEANASSFAAASAATPTVGGVDAEDAMLGGGTAEQAFEAVNLYRALIIRVFVMYGSRILFQQRCPRNMTVGDLLITMGKKSHDCVLKRNDNCMTLSERIGDWGESIVVFDLLYRRIGGGRLRGMHIPSLIT